MQITKILIIKPSSLGDIVCALPVAQAIRDQLPDAQISWVVKSRFRDIVQRCPTINGRIIEFEHSAGLSGLSALRRTMKAVSNLQFDAVLDFQGLLRSGLITWAANAPLKIGSPDGREGSQLACHKICQLPSGGRETHAIKRLLQFLPEIGLKPELQSSVTIHGDSPDELDPRLIDARPVVIIPNSRGTHKEWPKFPELTSALLRARPDVLAVWDSHLPWDASQVDHQDRLVNLTTRTSLLQMIELLRRARLVIANDSGPLHIAAALGTPTLGLFGPTSPDRYGPYPLSNSRNNALSAPGTNMSELPLAQVLTRILDILYHEESAGTVAA